MYVSFLISKFPVKLNLYLLHSCKQKLHTLPHILPTTLLATPLTPLLLRDCYMQYTTNFVSYGKIVSQHTIILYSTRPHNICNYTTEHIYHSTQLSCQKHPEKITLFYNFFLIYPHSLVLCIHYDIPQHPTSPHPVLPCSNLLKM